MNRVARIGAAGAVLFAVGTGEARANPIPAPPWYENPVVLGAAVAGGVGIAALVVWALVSDRSAASDRVAFSEEDVTVRLEPTSALVTGRYAFHATGAAPARMAIRYPFPADPHLGAIRDVTVLDPTGRALPWAWHGDAVEFEVPLQPEATTRVTVSYRQAHDGTFSYLLTSTGRWGRPLDRARFVVEVPYALGEPSSTYDLGPVQPLGDLLRYETTRWRFMPDRELTLSLDAS